MCCTRYTDIMDVEVKSEPLDYNEHVASNKELLSGHNCSVDEPSEPLSSVMKRKRWKRDDISLRYYKQKKQCALKYRAAKPSVTPQVYTCELCNEQFVMKMLLSRHMQTHVDDPLMCKVCHQVFLVQDSVTNHKCSPKDDDTKRSDTTETFRKQCANSCPAKSRIVDVKTEPESATLSSGALIIKWPYTSHTSQNRDAASKTGKIATAEAIVNNKTGELLHNNGPAVHSTNSRTVKSLCLRLEKRLQPLSKSANHGDKLVMTQKYTTSKQELDSAENQNEGENIAISFNTGDEYVEPKASRKKKYVCDNCGYACDKLSVLVKHKARKNPCKKLECTVCKRKFVKFEEYRTHSLFHSQTGSAIDCDCSICHLKFESNAELVEHYEQNVTCRPYICNRCTERFSTRAKMTKHKNSEHYYSKVTCPECGHVSPDKYKLAVHMLKHSGEQPYRCIVCSYACKQTMLLKTHCRIQHADIDWTNTSFTCPMSCQVCKAKLETLQKFYDHNPKACEAFKKFPCSVCGKMFRTNESRRIHMHAFHEHQ